jgi:hypothetical protein
MALLMVPVVLIAYLCDHMLLQLDESLLLLSLKNTMIDMLLCYHWC